MNVIALPQRVPVSEVPDLAAVVRSLGFLSDEEGQRLDALAASQYVLVRIDGQGERWRCGRCNAKHTHFTLMCIERPFRGLTHGLLAYWQNVGSARTSDLSPTQQARLDSLRPLFGEERPMPNLADRHPETARRLATPERDVDLGAWVLGTIDPISPLQASVLMERINARARRAVIRF